MSSVLKKADKLNLSLSLLPSEVFYGIHLRAILLEVLMNLIHNMCFEITL